MLCDFFVCAFSGLRVRKVRKILGAFQLCLDSGRAKGDGTKVTER